MWLPVCVALLATTLCTTGTAISTTDGLTRVAKFAAGDVQTTRMPPNEGRCVLAPLGHPHWPVGQGRANAA